MRGPLLNQAYPPPWIHNPPCIHPPKMRIDRSPPQEQKLPSALEATVASRAEGNRCLQLWRQPLPSLNKNLFYFKNLITTKKDSAPTNSPAPASPEAAHTPAQPPRPLEADPPTPPPAPPLKGEGSSSRTFKPLNKQPPKTRHHPHATGIRKRHRGSLSTGRLKSKEKRKTPPQAARHVASRRKRGATSS